MSKDLITGAEAMMRSLEHQGVTTIFGYPGGSIMPTFDALYDHQNTLNHILVRHEQGAAHAAQGYARVSGKVGVCLVTSGPGATNTITGIADAMIDSTPIVVIAGQVGTGFLGTDAFQEVDLVGITQPIAKWSYQIRRAEDVAWAIARAFYIASSGRPGPVVLDFAKNAQVEKTKYEPTQQEFIRSYVPVPDTDEESVKAAAELINNAERPLVLVGQGVELGSAQEELRIFIEKADMPAGCTLLGLSALPTDHPLNKGMLGMHGNLGPNINTNKCDVLIAVGMRFDDRVTGNLATYAKQAKVIHFDIDPAEVNKNVKVDIAVLGDCKKTLAAVTGLLKKNRHTEWVDSFKEYEAVEEYNRNYKQLLRDGKYDEAEGLFRQTRPLEQKLLARFKQEQDAFVQIDWYGNVLYPHEICSTNLRLLGGAVRNLKEQRLSSALRKLYQVDNNAYAFNFDEEVYRHFTDYVFHQPKDRLKWGYGRLPEHENLYGTVKQLLQKEKQLETLTGSGMKEMDYREEITSLEHACSKLVVSLMNIVQQMEKSVTEIFEL